MGPAPSTFLLGVGCQKGGTSWLHEHLAASPQCDPGFRKEYHVFDGLDLPDEAWMRRRIMRRAADAAAALERGDRVPPMGVVALRQAAFYAQPELYVDYFTGLLAPPGIRLTADITPSYALLPAERLSWVRSAFEQRGVRAAAVFLMRDPVDRLVSQVRMNAGRHPERFPGPVARWVEELHTHANHETRSRYDLTLAALDASFPRDQVFLAFYERLFDADLLRSLSDFLGIDHHEPDLDRRVNASPEADALPEDLQRRLARHFRPTYDAVAARTGVDLTEVWPSARLL